MADLAQARRDLRRHIEADFGESITLTAPDTTQVQVVALVSTHHIQVNPETGQIVNAKNVHFSVPESALVDLSYPIRNANNEVDLKDHLVTFVDSAGITRTYNVAEWWPDETLGLIVTQLEEYEV